MIKTLGGTENEKSICRAVVRHPALLPVCAQGASPRLKYTSFVTAAQDIRDGTAYCGASVAVYGSRDFKTTIILQESTTRTGSYKFVTGWEETGTEQDDFGKRYTSLKDNYYYRVVISNTVLDSEGKALETTTTNSIVVWNYVASSYFLPWLNNQAA